ncbi:MAG: hypothetical protein R2771_09445 [Saprospiraceae bacterium]
MTNSALKLPKSLVRILLMGHGLSGLWNILKWYFNTIRNYKYDPYYVFDWLFSKNINFENKIVFFVAGSHSKYDLFNENYKNKLPEIISLAKENGYEIGYHPSYFASTDEVLFEKELLYLESINKEKIKWIRSHFLRYDIKKTSLLFEKYMMKYDSTFGSNDMIGFRCGTGFPFFLYDFENEKKSILKEIPLVFMDSSVYYFMCQNNPKCFVEVLHDFLEKNKYNTHITFNFHNSTFDKSLKDRAMLKSEYLKLLEDIG